MAAAKEEVLEQTEFDRVVRWRVEELERAGYDARAALMIALRTDVDLHLAADLVRRGCAPKTALRILV